MYEQDIENYVPAVPDQLANEPVADTPYEVEGPYIKFHTDTLTHVGLTLPAGKPAFFRAQDVKEAVLLTPQFYITNGQSDFVVTDLSSAEPAQVTFKYAGKACQACLLVERKTAVKLSPQSLARINLEDGKLAETASFGMPLIATRWEYDSCGYPLRYICGYYKEGIFFEVYTKYFTTSPAKKDLTV